MEWKDYSDSDSGSPIAVIQENKSTGKVERRIDSATLKKQLGKNTTAFYI